MRSLLFVPADSAKKLDKAMTSGADALIIDLEDFDGRARARESAAAFLKETVVASQRPRRRCLPLTRSSNSASVSVPGTSRQLQSGDERTWSSNIAGAVHDPLRVRQDKLAKNRRCKSFTG
jgi:HpcH/HpaI aldolase/citrate lyase family